MEVWTSLLRLYKDNYSDLQQNLQLVAVLFVLDILDILGIVIEISIYGQLY